MNQQDSEQSLEDAFVLQCALPYRYKKISWPVADAILDRDNRSNAALFAVLTGHGDSFVLHDDIDPAQLQQFQMLEAKLDLTLNWLARVLAKDTILPEARELGLSVSGLRFCAAEALQAGEELLMEIFLDPLYPQAIHLYLQVLRADNNAESQSYTMTCRYLGMDETVLAYLEKFIFREQRRAIARQKKH